MLRLSCRYICPRCQTGSNLGRRTVATQHARGYRQPKLSNEIPIPEASADGQLPPWDQWKEKFGLVARPKPTLHNMATARKIVKGFGIAEASSPKVVLEVFAGPGAISRALCELPPSKMSKLIILENDPHYLPYLHSLAALDKRVLVRPLDGWFWTSYTQIVEEGLLSDIKVEEWDNSLKRPHPPHSQLHFVASAFPPAENGEALFNQIFRAVASRDWLFRYGAVPFSGVIPDSFRKRATAPLTSIQRGKLACMVDATVHVELAAPLKLMEDYAVNFFPPRTRGKGPENMVAVNFKPLGYQMMRVAGVPEWDFVLRALWIHKKTPVGSSLKFMAPGAQNMVKYMDQSKLGLLEKSPRDLSMDEWSILMDAFDKWPFHPRDNALSDSVLTTDKRIR
ncbi:Mitochondrial transcription factor 1 [Serendipita sp. 401]|nr:Mitochondrial transcription factor 1 [Serendipita sp. 401]